MDPYSIDARVEAGARMRTAALLLDPMWERGCRMEEVVPRLQALGLDGGGYWVEGTGVPHPGSDACLPELRRSDDGWFVLGTTERGLFAEWARFRSESAACREFLRDVIGHAVVSMGSTTRPPHVREQHRPQLRAAVEATLRLLDEPR